MSIAKKIRKENAAKLNEQTNKQSGCYLSPFACTYLLRLVVQHNKISAADIEAREVLACILGVENVVVNHVRLQFPKLSRPVTTKTRTTKPMKYQENTKGALRVGFGLAWLGSDIKYIKNCKKR